MKKIYILVFFTAISFAVNSQNISEKGNAILVSTQPNTQSNIGLRTVGTPDTTGIVNYSDFLPQFAPNGQLAIFGYQGGGYTYGNNKSANLKVCAQGYLNFSGTPVNVTGALIRFIKKEHDIPTAAATSKVVVKSYGMSPNRAANTTGSGSINTTLNWSGPNAVATSAVNLLFSDIDTLSMNYVAFGTVGHYAGDFAIAVDFSGLASGDTVGIACDLQNDAGNLDYAFHYYAGLARWFVTDQLFSDPASPTFGTGGVDNDIAIFAVLDNATGVNEFFNGMKLTTYPNPAVEKAVVEYTLEKKSSNISLTIFDQTGRKVIENKYSEQAAGIYKINVETANFAAGNYFYQLNANGHNFTKKFVVTK